MITYINPDKHTHTVKTKDLDIYTNLYFLNLGHLMNTAIILFKTNLMSFCVLHKPTHHVLLSVFNLGYTHITLPGITTNDCKQ